MTHKLTKSEAAVLQAFKADPNARLHYRDLEQAAGLTARGGRIVLQRMMDRSLIGQRDHHQGDYVLTFKGARVLGLTPNGTHSPEYFARLRAVADAAKASGYVGPAVTLDPHS